MAEDSTQGETKKITWGKWIKGWLKRLAITSVVLVVLAAILLGAAEHHTAKPSFCGSCHIMEPYYASWKADLHGGKLDTACVDCHYAPGERTTVKAKLRGLSQVASYVSGRYGATRPRAHVSNQSCMTSKCHGDLAFKDKPISLGTVTFVHSKHLQLDRTKQQAADAKLSQQTKTLKELLGDDVFGQLETVAKQAGPADARIDEMVRLTRVSGATIAREELEGFSQLHHRKVRIAQLADLQCTNCHSYSARDQDAKVSHPDHHFSVTTTACFTCHFNNEGFNTGTNKCVLCHTLPTQEIAVHEVSSSPESQPLETPGLVAKSVRMNHQTILERKVNCIACHSDVASDDSVVTRRDCERCHDQARYFADWKEPFSLDLVTRYHKLHVFQQRAKCLDCHSEIHHQLVREPDAEDGPGFLTPAMADCGHCHPHQHAEQVNLLRGAGGTGVPQSTPNLMFGSRTNCYGCHTEATVDELAGEVVRATQNGCIACHGDKHTETFEKWKAGLALYMSDAEEAFRNARAALDEKNDVSPEARQKASELLTAAEADLHLIKHGNGLHNITYAMELLDSVTARCQQAVAALEEN